jgi:ubiquinone biosynthesis protein UbiJ
MQKLMASVQPPAWLVQEVQNRIILSLNHVLQQEPQAMERLAKQSGKSALITLAPWNLHAQATPAGLLDLVRDERQPQLRVTVTDNLAQLAGKAASGDKPAIHIEGDVALAADINWLIDHVRWDWEEDLSRIMGDGMAHTLAQGLRAAAGGLRQFASSFSPNKV